MEGLTTGVQPVDDLIEGVRPGDNLVFLGDDGEVLSALVERFIAAMAGHRPLVLCNIAAPLEADVGGIVLDWHPVLAGRASAAARALAPQATVDEAAEQLRAADEEVGEAAAFVFDSLTAIQEAWGPDEALRLFLFACPQLFRRRSVALWGVERRQHRPAFLLRLEEITQVVVDVSTAGGQVEAAVIKADGRSAEAVGRRVRFRFDGDDITDVSPADESRARLGRLVREQRAARGLAQAELARRVGISPSALSQVERGVRGISGDTLMRVWEALGVPFGPGPTDEPGYRVARRSARRLLRVSEGMTAEEVIDDPVAGGLWHVLVRPGGSGRQPPLPVKATERVLVLRGVLDLEIGGRAETLHEGDGIAIVDASVTSWSNPSGDTTELLWVTGPSGPRDGEAADGGA